MNTEDKNKRTTSKDPDFLQVFARRWSIAVLLKPLEKSGLSPNQITVANFFVNNLAAVYLFTLGTYLGNLAALFFCLLSGAVDYIDGTIARMRKIDSKLGEWLDSTLDFIWQVLLIGGITFGVSASRWDGESWLVVGFFAILGLVVSNYISKEYREKFGLDLYKDISGLKEAFAGKKLTLSEYVYSNALAPASFLFISLFTIRYLVTIGAIFNIMYVCLMMIMVFSCVRAAALFYIFVLYFHFREGKAIRHKELIGLLDKYIQSKAK